MMEANISPLAQAVIAEAQRSINDETLELMSRCAVDLRAEQQEPMYLLEQNGHGLLPLGDISAVSAKAKQGKSWLCSIIAASVLGCDSFGLHSRISKAKVLILDTEQALPNVSRVGNRIAKLSEVNPSGTRLKVFQSRELSPEQRKQLLTGCIVQYNPNFVVIDGIRDLMIDFNNLGESSELITMLMQLSSKYHCHIMCVLHQNKSKLDDTMRGHCGTELQNKCSDVLSVKFDKTIKSFEVTSEISRNVLMEDFAFKIDQQGLPYLADGVASKECKTDELIKRNMAAIFSIDTMLKCSDLIDRYCNENICSKSCAQKHIKRAKDIGFIKKNNEDFYVLV